MGMVHPVCLSFLLSLLEPGLGGMTCGREVGVCSSRGKEGLHIPGA